jgi:glycosyltransferase involved in cell wall biosynthesis
MQFSKLSIIIPCYNEEHTVHLILDKIIRVELTRNIAKEIILVNDCSTDHTPGAIRRFFDAHPGVDFKLFNHDVNKGKGAAIHTGISHATGDYLVIQDADLEYDPQEYNILIQPVLDGFADVVLGSRFAGGNAHRVLFFWHSIGNKFLTFLSNAFTNLNLTDMETCYKLFRTQIIKDVKLKEKRFGFEPEVISKIARIPGIRVV